VLGLGDDEVRAVVVDDEPPGVPFVLRSVAVLVDVTDAARALGVLPGMRVIDAQQYAPSLTIDVVSAARLRAELAVVAEVLLACSPIVEPVLADCAVLLDLSGMIRPVARILKDIERGCARLGHKAHVLASPGTALSRALARACAVTGQSSGVVDDVPRALASLPLSALGLPRDLASTIAALGVQTAGALERLLGKGGVERLGADASSVLDVLSAKKSPLHGIAPPSRIREDAELDHAVASVEPIAFVLNRLCSRLMVRVRARRERLAEVSLSLHPDRVPALAGALPREKQAPARLTIAFPDPLADDRALLRALTVRLERTPLKGAVVAVTLEATRLVRRGPRQLSLQLTAADGESARADEALTALLAEMGAELGSERVGCLVVTNEPLPERMSRLAWPPPPPPARPPAPERRRPRRTPPLSPTEARAAALTSGGRFLAVWPWPLTLLPRPIHSALGAGQIVRREPLGILEGEGYARVYELIVLGDGRRALSLYDEELEDEWICGWFD
jgi:nucleotidyltransferase/DNA polymerase involved in DNA repair